MGSAAGVDDVHGRGRHGAGDHHRMPDAATMMEHRQPRMAGRYVDAFSWHDDIERFLGTIITETPLLHVCSGPVSDFGDVRVDCHVHPITPGVIADWTALPFGNNSFAAVFADPPWNLAYMKPCADFCKEALRVAPVAYVMSPWLWVKKGILRSSIWVREFPGINNPILIVRYQRDHAGTIDMFDEPTGCQMPLR